MLKRLVLGSAICVVLLGLLIWVSNLTSVDVGAQNVVCYKEQGGAKNVAGSGCEYEFQSGSTFDIQASSTVTWAADFPALSGGLTVNNWMIVSAPTAIATATPAVVINSVGVSELLVVRDGGVDAFNIYNGGGAKFAGPTAVATGVPALVVDSLGVSELFAVRDAATPVYRIDNGGVSNLLGNQLNLDLDLDTSITADTDDQIDIELEGNDQVVLIAVAAADSAATNEYTEIALTTPVDTTGTNTHNALTIDLAIGDASGGTNAATAVQIDGISGDAQVTETAVNIGAGWDTGISIPLDLESLGTMPTVLSTDITYTAAAGGSGTIATITDGEIWFVHRVIVNITTNFDATGDDATMDIGDDTDIDGFLNLADADMQTTATDYTGAQAGWQGIDGATPAGVFSIGGPHIYAPSGADQTIDWAVGETSGTTLSAGEATIYVYYTRMQ